MTKRTVVSWSTGKDSAWCLHELGRAEDVEVVGLLTTVTPEFGRVSIHGTRQAILAAQAARLGLRVWEVELPYPCPNERYEAAMTRATDRLSEWWDVSHVAFGDIFLEDVREYREELLEETSLSPIFPLWGRDTGDLATAMVDAGVDAVIVSAPEDSEVVDLVGRRWYPDRLAELAPSVDPCGERGEFHTCVVAGLGIEPIHYRIGEVVERDGARYVDLLLDGD